MHGAACNAVPEVRAGRSKRRAWRVLQHLTRAAAIFRIMCMSPSFCFPLFISNPAPLRQQIPAGRQRHFDDETQYWRGMAAQQSITTMENMTHH